uniref:Chitin-binding type-2 domain-containing protein n=1 Tax=Anopheles maculatus TaxID=74869 RepID=A0A182SWU7_9DIPT
MALDCLTGSVSAVTIPYLLVLFRVLSLSAAEVRVKRQDDDSDPDSINVEELCKDRPGDEYFRLSTDGDCREVVRCDDAGENGITRLASVRCPTGLYFDVLRQTCDWKANVKSCDLLGSKSPGHGQQSCGVDELNRKTIAASFRPHAHRHRSVRPGYLCYHLD